LICSQIHAYDVKINSFLELSFQMQKTFIGASCYRYCFLKHNTWWAERNYEAMKVHKFFVGSYYMYEWDCTVNIVTYWGFAWLIKWVFVLRIEYIGPLYSLLQHFRNHSHWLDTLDFWLHHTNLLPQLNHQLLLVSHYIVSG
jgi:hypothetical protein